MTKPVESVAVVGRDASLWLTALALQRAFGRTGLRVRAVELPSYLGAVDVYTAIPSLDGLHRMLGLDDGPVLSACSGVYSLGQRFANWSKSRPAFTHAWDTHGIAINHVDFVQYWVKARSEGLKVDLEEFSLGAAAAKHGRYVVYNDATESFSKAAPGYHLNAVPYASLLKHRAIRGGVEALAGRVGRLETRDGRILSVALDEGTTIEADLFVDASGPDAVLIREMPGAEFAAWGRWLPCDRILAASGKRLEPLPAFSQISAFGAGWIGMYPLQDRTAVVAVYDSGLISDEQMLRDAAVLSGLTLSGDAVAGSFRAGARRRAWVGNCVAVGDAAVSLEPLDSVNLHLIHTGLSHLISLFPADAQEMPEAEVYNAAVASHARNIRDFQIAHYKLNQRLDEPFWDRAREAAVPEPLQYKIDLFAGRGRVALYDDEAFQEHDWTSLFVGHGLIPRDYDPLVDTVSAPEQMQQFQRMLRFIAEEVQDMPSLEAHLEIHAPRPRGAGGF